MKLVIEHWHPTRLNQLIGCHWATAGRLKKGDRDMVGVYARLANIPKATGRRKVSLTITLGPKQRAADPDAYWKSLLDALTHAALVVDDSPRWVELGPVTFRRGKERSTTIVLEDLDAPRPGRKRQPRPPANMGRIRRCRKL